MLDEFIEGGEGSVSLAGLNGWTNVQERHWRSQGSSEFCPIWS